MLYFYLLIGVFITAAACYAFWLYTRSPPRHHTHSSHQSAVSHIPSTVVHKRIKEQEKKREYLTPEQLFTLAETYQYGRFGYTRDAKRAIALFKESIAKSRNNSHIGKCYMAIGRVFTEGDPSHLKPDARMAIHHFLKALQCGYEDGFFEIAAIYSNGLHPNYLPDKLTAGKLYTAVAYDSPFSEYSRALARQRGKDINGLSYADLDALPEPDRDYYSLPQGIIDNVLASIHSAHIRHIPITPPKVASNIASKIALKQRNRSLALPQHTTTTPPPVTRVSQGTQVIQINDEYDLEEALWNDLEARHRSDRRPDRPPRPVPNTNNNILDLVQDQTIYNDSQNVHSTSVQNAAANILDEISTNISDSFDVNKRNFLTYISKRHDISPEEKENINKVLESLKDREHSKYNKSETDVFNIVLSRINDPSNKDKRDDMLKVFAQNIASGVEHKNVVCSTGKIVRMIGALDGMDDKLTHSLKPEWAINEEIATTAAHIREEVLKTATPIERAAYESPTPNEAIAQELTVRMQQKMSEKCHKDYVDSKILSEDALNTKLQDYLESF